MVAPNWSDADTAQACDIWQEYQTKNDLSKLHGTTAGIDPVSKRVWFGESAAQIVEKMEAEGSSAPLYFIRVGFDHYLRKGVHR